LFFQHSTTKPAAGVEPYDALRLMGRDLYIREGCVGCHSQQIRMLRAEVQRYGPYSLASESVYERPFLWGSKRTGPDLTRVGERYSDEWHRIHLRNPRVVVPESNMPGYPWLAQQPVKSDDIGDRMRALRMLGVPYTDAQIAAAAQVLQGKTEEDAVVAYLQGLGTGARKAAQAAQAATKPVQGAK
ncbi:MAG: cytochrome-c oxidase, cbb3-type subunit II, partial [Burkholderiales bacterium]|nr:cytochrome-c oxidase, cbb3-type subunit II [Burkholderiales bacterium]